MGGRGKKLEKGAYTCNLAVHKLPDLKLTGEEHSGGWGQEGMGVDIIFLPCK